MATSGIPPIIVPIEARLERLRQDLRAAEQMVTQSAGRMRNNARVGTGGRGPRDSLFGMALSQRDVGASALPGVTKRMILGMAGFALTLATVDQALRGFAKAMGDARLSLSGRLSQGLAGFTSGLVQGVQGIPVIGPLRDLAATGLGAAGRGMRGGPFSGAAELLRSTFSGEEDRKQRLAQMRTAGMVTVVEMQRRLSQQAEIANIINLRPDLRDEAETKLKYTHELDDTMEMINRFMIKNHLSNQDVRSLKSQADNVNLLQLGRELQEANEKRASLDLSEAVETALGSFKLAGSIGGGSGVQNQPAKEMTVERVATAAEAIASWLTTSQFGFA